MNRPIKLECNITPDWKGLLGTNTQAYLCPFVSYKEKKIYEQGPLDHIQ